MIFNKEKQTDKGVLRYRRPDISEAFDFLSAVEAITSLPDIFKIKGKFVPKLENLIDWKSLGYVTYQDYCNDLENNLIVTKEIADEVWIAVTSVFAKKPLSLTPSVQPRTDSPEMSS